MTWFGTNLIGIADNLVGSNKFREMTASGVQFWCQLGLAGLGLKGIGDSQLSKQK